MTELDESSFNFFGKSDMDLSDITHKDRVNKPKKIKFKLNLQNINLM